MNYLTEIKMFNEWLETNELSTSGITLWYALIYLAYRSGWQSPLRIPLSVIMLRTKMSRSTIYREREVLRDYGLIDFEGGDGRQSSSYRIISFEERVVSQTETQSGTQASVVSHIETQVGTQTLPVREDLKFVSHTETQDETQIGVVSHVASHTETQAGTQNEMPTDVVSHIETQKPVGASSEAHLGSGKIEKVPIYINKDRYKDKRGSGGKEKSGVRPLVHWRSGVGVSGPDVARLQTQPQGGLQKRTVGAKVPDDATQLLQRQSGHGAEDNRQEHRKQLGRDI